MTATEKRYQREFKKIDADMELVGKLPNDFDAFVNEKATASRHFIFYSQKEKRAYCTRCEHDIPVDKQMRHNQPYVCPSCNTSTIAKASGRVKNGLMLFDWSIYTEKNGDAFILRYFRHSTFFKAWEPRQVETHERYRSFYKGGKPDLYMMGWHKKSGVYRWTFLKNPRVFYVPSERDEPLYGATVYNDTFDIEGTGVQYSCLNEFRNDICPLEATHTGWYLQQYLNYYVAHPSIEQIIKVGWYRLADYILYTGYHIQSGRTLAETLEIKNIKLLREISNNDPNYNDLLCVQQIEAHRLSVKVDDLKELRTYFDETYDFIHWDSGCELMLDGTKYATLHKLIKYAKKESPNSSTFYHDYFKDYLPWLEALGYDMKSEFNLFPKDFVKRHDEVCDEYVRKKNEIERAKLEAFEMSLAKARETITEDDPMALSVNNLFIRLPYNTDEIRKEGEALHHCVATYINRVVDGKTTILFVRQKENPDVPFYTLEWNNNHIVQCRGLHNADMTNDVKLFTTLFEEKMQAVA